MLRLVSIRTRVVATCCSLSVPTSAACLLFIRVPALLV
jgi:hypothetical protein